MTEFYKFVCAAPEEEPGEAELLIFGPIGDWEDFGEVSAQAFAKALSVLPASVKRLDIHINSPGGSLFEASAIFSRLADHRSTKHVFIDGLAASAATIIAMVGHKIYVRANATMMIHMPSGIVAGNAEDMRQIASALDTVTESMVNVYEKRTGNSRADIMAMLKAETWMSPDEAVENGFADEVRGVVKAAASLGENRYNFNGAEFDLSRFRNIPAFSATKPKRKETMKEKVTPTAEGGGETPPAPATPPAAPPIPATPTPPAPPPAPAPAPPSNTYDDGIAAERARIAALQELDRPATHDIVTAAIKDGKTATEILPQIVAAMDKAQAQGNRRADAASLTGIPGADGGQQDDKNNFVVLVREKIQARRTSNARSRGAMHSRN